MKYLDLAEENVQISQLILGCMRLSQKGVDNAETLLMTALEVGINYFDHADIYGDGQSEEVFGQVLARQPSLREKILIQTKCGICKGGDFTFYDLSKDYILRAVEGSLKRLQTEYVDTLLLHRPDILMDAEEIAPAFEILQAQGKVRHFGVSNMNAMQIACLQRFIPQKLRFNQMQFNPVHAGMAEQGVNVNMKNQASVDHDGSVLDYCRLHDVRLQAWSILQAEGTRRMYIGDPDYPALNGVLKKLGDKYQITPTAVVAAWIMRHPAKMQPIVGTTDPAHLREICRSTDVMLTKREWYEIYLSLGRKLP